MNPNVLKWAREAAHLSLEEAADKLCITGAGPAGGVEKLKAYESGEREPPRGLLLEMSKRYRRPLLTFYLAEPPRKGDRGEDFRTTSRSYLSSENILVDAMIRNIKSRQATVRSALIDEDEAEPIPFAGSSRIADGVKQVAGSIQKTINFSLSEFRASPKAEDAFSLLRSKIEAKRVFVLLIGDLGSHHSSIDADIFRGFVLSDDIAPFIVINDQDSKAAWSFTLLHELVHIWLGRTGLSGGSPEQRIEKFCNDVASEILLPDDEILDISVAEGDFASAVERISDYAIPRKLSSSLVAYKLYRKGKINFSIWKKLDEHYRNLRREAKFNEKVRNKRETGPSYFTVRRYKLGNALVSLVERLVYSGALTATKAGMVLGIKPLKVHKLFDSRVKSTVRH
ncbi:ImmA/IrrE family metallo-endopeptidase [Nitrosospira multiformis]|uniref:Zn-dependent peptidase ImmA, M78 family n=1 Tax=Nitrosospira multiformis TaxID=1231 RepID=A0A1I7IYX6_9PROT|nr:XRE family transcriptional regulator [Nitrosospira multiformis]SFU78021.1 Zn-dependent peptidase ImmA, M78 family [Nitrosospira multiformis]